jgi:hypothetical protein
MMNDNFVQKDERTISVENASYRWAYLILSFGILFDVAYRGLVRNEAGWDLMALVILAGLASTVYQGSQRILTRRWVIWSVLIALLAAIVSAVIVFIH